MYIHMHKIHRSLNKLYLKRFSPRHSIIKLSKNQTVLKAAREKKPVTYVGTPIRLPLDFLAETLQARREWADIFRVLKEKNRQPEILILAKSSFRNGERKVFLDRRKLSQFMTPDLPSKRC